MEQRPLRLGDIVDDYCPRERRVTNHAVVAIVEGAIRQTRCATCDAEHIFKGGREPRRRKPTDMPDAEAPLAEMSGATLVMSEPPAPPVQAAEPAATEDPPMAAAASTPEVLVSHRPLIRAALPKIEGELPPPRQIPEFTMHQRPQGRPGRGRFDGPWRGQQDNRPFRGRPMNPMNPMNGSGSANGSGDAPDDDEVNGNVAGPQHNGQHNGRSGSGAPAGHGGHGGHGGHRGGAGAPGAPGGPADAQGSGRRRRGRRRRGR